jgi:hypothetical protein
MVRPSYHGPVRCISVGLALATFVAAFPARAYRPFDGTDADVAPSGEFELEIGPAYLAGRDRKSELALPALVLNQGLFPRWELVVDARNRVALHRDAEHPRVQLDDDDVQLKWVMREGSLQGKTGPSVATEFGVLLPTTNEERNFGGLVDVIVSQKWSALALHWNLSGATRPGVREVGTSLIVEGPFHRVRPVLEIFAARELSVASTVSALSGFIWRIGDDSAFDFGLRRGLAGDEPFTEVRLGLTWATQVFGAAESSLPDRESEPRTRLTK